MWWLWIVCGAAALMLIVLPLFLLAGAWRHPLAPMLRRYDYAHRGLHDNEAGVPENSLLAFSRAVEGGFGIELDVQLSRDGELVVFHDFALSRMTGEQARVSDYLASQLRMLPLLDTPQRIPMLSQVLELVNGQVPILIEIKTPGADTQACPVLYEALRGYNGPYAVQSFNPLAVRWFKKRDRKTMRGQLAQRMSGADAHGRVLPFILENLLGNFFSRPHYIAYRDRDRDKLCFRVCTKVLRLKNAVWTVTAQGDYDRLKPRTDYMIFEGFTPPQ